MYVCMHAFMYVLGEETKSSRDCGRAQNGAGQQIGEDKYTEKNKLPIKI